MESNWHGDGWGWIQMSAGTGGDGFKVRGDGWDGTKISSLCRTLPRTSLGRRRLSFIHSLVRTRQQWKYKNTIKTVHKNSTQKQKA